MKKLFLVLFVSGFFTVYPQETIKYINVNGTSETVLSADQINITVQIKTIDESLEESKRTNDKHSSELLSVLKNYTADDDIDISPVYFGKNYEYRERERIQKGFFTEKRISFLLKDMGKYYELMNKLSVYEYFDITDSEYRISDYEKQHRLTYEKALKAAKEKADYMAAAMNIKPGEILEIEELNALQNYPNPFNTVTVESSGNVSGKVVLRRSVRVKFGIM